MSGKSRKAAKARSAGGRNGKALPVAARRAGDLTRIRQGQTCATLKAVIQFTRNVRRDIAGCRHIAPKTRADQRSDT